MEKQKSVNWLMVITVFLLLVSAGVFVYKFFFANSAKNSSSGGESVEHKEIVSNDESSSVFSTDNLVFKYKYLNSLSSKSSGGTKIVSADINQKGDELVVIFEKESLCSEDFKAVSQSGYYEKSPEKLILSVITSSDFEEFNIPCLVSNSFKITNFESSVSEDFEIFYRDEEGKEFDLMACSYNGILYGQGDVFTTEKNKEVCTCEKGDVVCK